MDSALRVAWKRSKAIAVTVTLLSLVTSNLLTLTNSNVHAEAYGFVEGIARATGGMGVLQNSPTEVARRTGGATKDLRFQNEQLVSRNRALLSENDRMAFQKKDLAHRTLVLADATEKLIATTSVLRVEAGKATARAQWYESRHDEMRRVAPPVLERASARLSTGAARSVSTLPGKVFPGLGAAFAIGATGLDLIDICTLIRDMNYLEHRYLSHPEHSYQVMVVVSPWLRRPIGLVVMRRHAQRVELLDILAAWEDMPDILRAVQNWLALSCCDAAVLSLTESFARQLAPYASSVEATEFRIMGNPFCSADILNRLNNHWWLTGGDTDYR